MSTIPVNQVTWFEVATDDPDATEKFYGELFGWTYESGAGGDDAGMDYRTIHYPGQERAAGGVYANSGMPQHAVFTVAVADVAAVCARAEELGGTVLHAVTEPASGPAFGYLRDSTGNVFGVFTPA